MKDRIKQSIKIEWQKIKALQPENVKLPYNTQHLKKSLLKYGFSLPFYVWESEGEYYCIDGHHRLDVLNELISEGHKVPKELNAVEIEAKDRKEAISILVDVYNQRSNPFAEEYLIEFLEVENIDIQDVNIESVNVVSETIEEETVLEAEEDDFDSTPPTEAITVLGDLYEIGEHRLLCGDSTDSDQVAKLMNGQKAELVFTDPPYGNGSSGKYGRGQLGVRTIMNDDSFECVNDFFNLRICDAYVFFLQWRTFKEAIQTLENNDLTLKTIAVWDKKNAGLNGAGGMAEQWEAIIVAGNIKYSRFGGNVFNVSREQKKRIDSPHPHQKPIQLLSDILEYFQDYKLLVDPFSGSGSTMVACHQLKRKCYGMELDPKYADVIVKRMIKLDPTLKVKRNGKEIDKKEFS
jgi:DNA modification methylase